MKQVNTLTNKRKSPHGAPWHVHPPTGVDWYLEMPRIIYRYTKGAETLEAIGQTYGVTREYIRQLLSKFNINHNDGGMHLRAKRRKAARRVKVLNNAHKRAQRLGMTGAEWQAHQIQWGNMCDPESPFFKFVNQRKNIVHQRPKLLNNKWDISFADWWRVWERSGKWLLRGRGADMYVMGRKDTSKPFNKDNVHIVTFAENSARTYINTPAHIRTKKAKVTRAKNARIKAGV